MVELRITGGERRGISLKAPRGLKTRPTSALVREALFNVLAFCLPGASVLDLFAGSGSLGIEALSRGAVTAVLVEESPVCCRIIKENLVSSGYADRAQVHLQDVFLAMHALDRRGTAFDLVFADPPYGRGLHIKTLQALGVSGILKPGAQVVLEHGKEERLPERVGVLIRRFGKVYGDSALSFYLKPVEGER